MNIYERDILINLSKDQYINQRSLAQRTGHSLGTVNQTIKSLMGTGYIDELAMLTSKAQDEFKEKKPKRAIILAAGFGMRMVPINTETTKGLIEV
ncbi:MAG: winged helix-turn-helix transcriptional regulator, partial [Clostridium saudiense]|nr:winged helix-turn-helix transcriptional regulator [Clostridium saudiense]